MQMNLIDGLIENPNYYYDGAVVEGYIKYCENELTLTDGSDLHLLDSFKLWAEDILGWYEFVERSVFIPNPDGIDGHYETRRIRKRLRNKQYLIVGRGASKSLYDSSVQSYFENIDTSTTQQITTAPTMKQAEEVLSPIRTAITRWTIDGNLVASYVTAGSMLADRVRGGTFIVGGQGTGADGSIIVQRSDGSIVGIFDKNGITLGGFNVDGGGNLTTDKDVSVQFGKTCYINKDEIMIGEWTLYDGYMEGTWLESDDHAQYWDNNGELHATEIYIHQPWWSKGTDHRWSVTETVESIWDDVKALKQYVYNGGWCKNDGGGDTCTGTHSCTCVSGYDVCSHCDGSDDLECDCEAGCDKADTSGSCSCDDKTTCSDCPSHCSKAICVKGG